MNPPSNTETPPPANLSSVNLENTVDKIEDLPETTMEVDSVHEDAEDNLLQFLS